MGVGGCLGQEQVYCKHLPSLQYHSMVLLFSTGQLLNHSWRGGGQEMRSIPSPTRLTVTCCQELLTLLCLLISTARRPAPSTCLALSKQHQSHRHPAAWHLHDRGTGVRLSLPFPPKKEASSSLCTFAGQPKVLPGTLPHSVKSSFWESISTMAGNLQESSLGNNKALASNTQKCSFKCRKTPC